MTKSIAAFQDQFGRITTWPSDRRKAHQQAILHYLKGLFESGVSYTQGEIEQILADHTTFGDGVNIISELLEADYLATDGEIYWRADGRPGR